MQLPAGYVVHDRGAYRVIGARLELDEMVALLVRSDRGLNTGERARGGRGSARRVVLPGGKAVFVRQYVRGGLVRHFVADLYFLRPERPVRELVVTEAARAAGCPVPRVLAVYIEEAFFGYRGWLVTEAVAGARPLIDVYEERPSQQHPMLLAKVGKALRGLHAAGVYHVDLTGHNVLVDAFDRVSFVDFDRGFVGAPDTARFVEAAFARFWRSMDKLARAREIALEPDSRKWLREGYDS